MKKFIRYLRLRRQSPPDQDEYGKKRQRYEADYTLEPFAGLTPAYVALCVGGGGAGGGGGGLPQPRAPGRPPGGSAA